MAALVAYPGLLPGLIESRPLLFVKGRGQVNAIS